MFDKKSIKDTELEWVSLQIENLVREKGIVRFNELIDVWSHLNKKEKDIIIKFLGDKVYIRKEEDMFVFNEKIEYDDILEDDIFSSLIRPEFVDTMKDHIQVGSKFYMGRYCTEFPDEVGVNWLSNLSSEVGNMDFSIHVKPITNYEAQVRIDKEIKSTNFALYTQQNKGTPSPRLQQKMAELQQTMADIVSGKYKIYDTALYLAAKGSTKEDSKTLSKNINSSLLSASIESMEANNFEENLLKSILPIAQDVFKKKTLWVPDNALANSFSFGFTWLQIDEENGTLLGFNEVGLPIAKSLWEQNSYSWTVTGVTGFGKSFFIKFFLLQQYLYDGVNIVVIDPALNVGVPAEYKAMCELLNGNYISFTTSSKNIPNIMSLYAKPEYTDEESSDTTEGHFYNEVARVTQLVKKLLGSVGPEKEAQWPIVEEAIMKAYEDVGITKDTKNFWKKDPPTLDNLMSALKYGLSQNKASESRATFEALIRRLKRFVGRGLYSFINRKKAELQLDNQFTVFEFKNTPDEVKPILTAVVMNYIKSKAMGNLEKTLIVLEEAHQWLSDPELSKFLAKLIVMVRKSNTGIVLIFQSIDQLKECKEGLTILDNVEFKVLFRTRKPLIEKTTKAFGLNKREAEILLSSERGSGILMWGDNHYRLFVEVDEETHRIITTKPSEVAAMRKEQPEDLPIMFYEEKLGHKSSNLTQAREGFFELHKDNPKYKKKIAEAPKEEQKELLILFRKRLRKKTKAIRKKK